MATVTLTLIDCDDGSVRFEIGSAPPRKATDITPAQKLLDELLAVIIERRMPTPC